MRIALRVFHRQIQKTFNHYLIINVLVVLAKLFVFWISVVEIIKHCDIFKFFSVVLSPLNVKLPIMMHIVTKKKKKA